MDVGLFDIDWTHNACDFDFLPPVDEEVVPVDDVSCKTTDSGDTTPPQPQPRRRRKRPNLIQVELVSLHQEAADLARQLEDLQAQRAASLDGLTATETKWEKMARNQLQLKLKAMRENHELRDALVEQSKLRQVLEDVVLKKPRLMMMKVEDDQWRVLKLSANGEKRLAAIHAIADRQMELIESDMLALGLADSMEDLLVVRHNDIDMFSEGLRLATVAGTLAAVGMAAWKTLAVVLRKSDGVAGESYTYAIDDDTLYMRTIFGQSGGQATVASSIIIKKFVLDHGNVMRIVFRTILDDEAMPSLDKTYATDQYGIHMEQLAGGGGVLYKSYVKSHFVLPRPEDMNDLAELMGAMYLDQLALTSPPSTTVDPVTMIKDVFDGMFRQFEVVLHDELSRQCALGNGQLCDRAANEDPSSLADESTRVLPSTD